MRLVFIGEKNAGPGGGMGSSTRLILQLDERLRGWMFSKNIHNNYAYELSVLGCFFFNCQQTTYPAKMSVLSVCQKQMMWTEGVGTTKQKSKK